ncbi:MAG: hypothetical protein ACOCYX_07055 [Spirochaetota bacterium]
MTVKFVREALSRLSHDGWKRHAAWLIAEYGRLARLASVALYKNYPDRDGRLTSVRLHSWYDPLRAESACELPRIVESFDERFAELRERLAAGSVSRTGDVLIVPILAGPSWWGALVVLPVEERVEADAGDAEETCVFLATLLGDSIRDESTRQALRWSERLHRIQRDIALAAGRGGSTRGSVSELLSLICEFGEFDAGSVDLLRRGWLVRIAQIGLPPEHASHEPCEACAL